MANRTTIKGNFQTGDTPTQANFEEFIDASVLDGATAKTTPIDADSVALLDSADSNALKRTTWQNVKAVLKTYFDTLYQAVLVSGTNIKTVNGSSILGSGNIQFSIDRLASAYAFELIQDPPNPDSVSFAQSNVFTLIGYTGAANFTITENEGVYTAELIKTGEYSDAFITSVSHTFENPSPIPFVPIWFDSQRIIIPSEIVSAQIGTLVVCIEG